MHTKETTERTRQILFRRRDLWNSGGKSLEERTKHPVLPDKHRIKLFHESGRSGGCEWQISGSTLCLDVTGLKIIGVLDRRHQRTPQTRANLFSSFQLSGWLRIMEAVWPETESYSCAGRGSSRGSESLNLKKKVPWGLTADDIGGGADRIPTMRERRRAPPLPQHFITLGANSLIWCHLHKLRGHTKPGGKNLHFAHFW